MTPSDLAHNACPKGAPQGLHPIYEIPSLALKSPRCIGDMIDSIRDIKQAASSRGTGYDRQGMILWFVKAGSISILMWTGG